MGELREEIEMNALGRTTSKKNQRACTTEEVGRRKRRRLQLRRNSMKRDQESAGAISKGRR